MLLAVLCCSLHKLTLSGTVLRGESQRMSERVLAAAAVPDSFVAEPLRVITSIKIRKFCAEQQLISFLNLRVCAQRSWICTGCPVRSVAWLNRALWRYELFRFLSFIDLSSCDWPSLRLKVIWRGWKMKWTSLMPKLEVSQKLDCAWCEPDCAGFESDCAGCESVCAECESECAAVWYRSSSISKKLNTELFLQTSFSY